MTSSKKKISLEQEGRAQGGYNPEIFSTLAMSYRAYFWPILATLVMGFLGRTLLLGNANLIGWWVDSLCHNEILGAKCRPVPAVFTGWGAENFLHLLLVCVLTGFALTWVFRIVFSRLSARAVSLLYDETTYRTSRFPMRFFDTTPVGRIVTRFSSDYGNVFRLFGGPLAEFLSILFDLTNMILLVTLASPFYLPVILIYIALNYWVYRLNRENLRSVRRDLSASRSPSISHFAETAQGAPTIRSFNREQTFQKRFERLDRFFLDQKLKTVKTVLLFSWQMNALTALLLLATGMLSWVLLQKGLISVGSIGVAFGLITLSGTTVLMFFEWLAQVEEALIGVERMNQYLRAPLETAAALPACAQFATDHAKETGHEIEGLQDLFQQTALPVEFRHVRFRYHSTLPWVLNDLTLAIRAGEKVGIIGRTGGGKSSVIQALLQLYPIDEGEVLIADRPIAKSFAGPGLNLTYARRLFAYISQDPTLFRGSLRENLDYEGRCQDSEIFAVLNAVGLPEWATVSGLKSVIEEKGRNLSLGEKQLICLVRAALQKSPVLIMDEATSSIDPQSEEKISAAAQTLFRGRTQIIIAHRLSTLESCDRVLWLKQGRLFAEGTPGEILPRFEKSDYEGPGGVVKPSP